MNGSGRAMGVVAACLILASAWGARGDWDPGGDHEMHFPQLPDGNGWNVRANQDWAAAIADDWQASQTDPVSGIHFWFSVRQDQDFVPISIYTAIFADVPAGSGEPFGHPGALLWDHYADSSEYATRIYGTGDQGWSDPVAGTWSLSDHANLWQMNIDLAPDIAFRQEAGTVYWLAVGMTAVDPVDPMQTVDVGWSTSLDSWNAGAVASTAGDPDYGWQPLSDPVTAQPQGMAFVMVPEPASLGFLFAAGAGLLAAARWRRRHRPHR